MLLHGLGLHSYNRSLTLIKLLTEHPQKPPLLTANPVAEKHVANGTYGHKNCVRNFESDLISQNFPPSGLCCRWVPGCLLRQQLLLPPVGLSPCCEELEAGGP